MNLLTEEQAHSVRLCLATTVRYFIGCSHHVGRVADHTGWSTPERASDEAYKLGWRATWTQHGMSVCCPECVSWGRT